MSYFSNSVSDRTLWMMAVNFPLHSGQTAFTLDHSSKQVKQKVCRQVSVMDLLSSSPRHIGHSWSLSGEDGPPPSRDLDRRLLLFL